MAEAKERNITRKVVESRVYKVYCFDKDLLGNETTRFLGEETIKGRVSISQLEEKYNTKDIFTRLVKENIAKYQMSVNEFMKYATRVDEDDSATEVENSQELNG